MRIAYVIIDCNKRDGTARAVAEVAERMAARHDVHIFSHTLADVDTSRITWRRTCAWPWPELPKFVTFLANCSARMGMERFDIVHSAGCNTAHADVFTVQNVQPAKYRILKEQNAFASGGVLRTLHRWLYYRTTGWAERRLYQDGGAMYLPVSQGIVRELGEFHGIRPIAMEVIPNGADLERFTPALRDTDRAAARAEYGLAPDDFALIFVGGEWKRKGLEYALEALPHIPDPKVKLLVMGRDAAQQTYEERSRELGVRERIVFGGFTDRVDRAYAAADLFLFPTHYEAFSLASVEAAASGLPLAAAKTNGTEELIRPGENGEFIPHDGPGIAEVVTRLLAAPERLAAMGRRAREIVEQEYSWDAITRRTEAAYERVLKRKEKG